MDVVSVGIAIFVLILAVVAVVIAFMLESGTQGPQGAIGGVGPTGSVGVGATAGFEIINLTTPGTVLITVLGIPGIIYYLNAQDDSPVQVALHSSIIVGQTFTITNLGPIEIGLSAARGFTMTGIPVSLNSGVSVSFQVTASNTAIVISS